MRICLISREYPPDTGWGGIGAYTFQHACALKNLGHDVEVVALAAKEAREDCRQDTPAGGNAVIPVHRAVWGDLLEELGALWVSVPYSHYALKSCMSLWRKFLELHTATPFDVVEAPEHLAEAFFPAITKICPLVIRLHTPHSKIVSEGYHNLTASFDHRLLSILERAAMLEADVLSSPSEDLARYVSFDAGVPLEEIAIVRNPVDTQKFSPEGPLSFEPAGRLTILFAGRLEQRKGVQYLIDAIPAIVKACPSARFLVVGADTNTGAGQRSVRAELEAKLKATGCREAVEFINHVPLDQMPAVYRSADICVVPSLYENGPYTILEAQASGKPVVTTTAGGCPEYVDASTGITVSPKDSAALADAIVRLADDANLRESMGAAARKRTLDIFEKAVIAKQAVQTYQLAVDRFAEKHKPLYRKTPEESLADFISLMSSYNRNLTDMLCRYSFSFRCHQWWLLAKNRPRLLAAKLAVECLSFLKPIFPATALRQKLQKGIDAREKEREEAMLQQILQTCRIRRNTAIPNTSQNAMQSMQPEAKVAG